MSFRGRRSQKTATTRDSAQAQDNAQSLVQSIIFSRDFGGSSSDKPPDAGNDQKKPRSRPTRSSKTQSKEERSEHNASSEPHFNDKTPASQQSKPSSSGSSSSAAHQRSRQKPKHIPDISSIVPYSNERECLICSHPITIFVASPCGHSNELCGTCVLKSLLFSKPQKSTHGDDNNERPPYVLKDHYQSLCQQNKSGSNTAKDGYISDAHLDSNFLSYCRSRDPLCWFCHTPMTPLLMSTTPISSQFYELFCAAVIVAKHDNRERKGSQTKSISDAQYTQAQETIARYSAQPDLIKQLTDLTLDEVKEEPPSHIDTAADDGDGQTSAPTNQASLRAAAQRENPLTIDHNPTLDLYTVRQTLKIYFSQPTAPSNDAQDGNRHPSSRTLTVLPRQYSLGEIIDRACSISCRLCDNQLHRQHDQSTDLSIYHQDTLYKSAQGVTYQTHPEIVPSITTVHYPVPSTTQQQKRFKQLSHDMLTISPLTTLQQSFTSLRHLQHHLSTHHTLEMCIACASVSYDFIPQRPTFNRSQLLAHATREKHSICELCYRQCYDEDELFAHLIDPSNGHYQCHVCTTTNTINQSSLASTTAGHPINDAPAHQNTTLTEQRFTFLRSVEALIAHYHDQHFICDLEVCKTIRDPYSMSVFSSPIELQAHQSKCHHVRQSQRTIDLTSFTRAFDSTPASSTTVTLGSDGRRVYGQQGKQHGKQYTLGSNDIFHWKRIIGLSSLTHQEQSLARASHHQQTQQGASTNDMNASSSSSTTAQPSQAAPPQKSYEELFPSLSSSTSSGGGRGASIGGGLSFKSSLNQTTSAGKTKRPQTQNQAFPVLGGGGGAASSTTSRPLTTLSSSSSQLKQTKLTPSTSSNASKPKPKVNRLDQFINWQSSAPSSTSSSRPPKNDDVFGDYDQYLQTNEVYYASQPVVNPFARDVTKYSSQTSKPATGNWDTQQHPSLSVGKQDQLTGNKDVDFPSTLGVLSPQSPPGGWQDQKKGKKGQNADQSKKQGSKTQSAQQKQKQTSTPNQNSTKSGNKSQGGGFLSPPATVAASAWGSSTPPPRSATTDIAIMQSRGLVIETSKKKSKKK